MYIHLLFWGCLKGEKSTSYRNTLDWFKYMYHTASDVRQFIPSKTISADLDLWDCLGRVKLVLYQNFIGLIQLFVVILENKNSVL